MPGLDGRSLTCSYVAGSPIFERVDLQLRRGSAVALLGPNGAGKTTLLRCLAGMLEPAAGAVALDDRPLDELSVREVAQQVSVVPQVRAAAFAFTALELVLMGLHSHLPRFGLDGAEQVAQARAALARMGVAELADRPITSVSGGEAQRIVMARTIVSGAPFWLLDEPTANLDVRHQLAVLGAVRAHVDDGGGCLAIVHDPNLVAGWFDRVVLLADGRVQAEGTPAEALTAETLEATYSVPMLRVGDAEAGAWIPAMRQAN